MGNIDEIIESLSIEKVKNINIINFLSNYPIYCIEKIGQSVMVKGKSDKKWVYISCELEEELKRLKEKLTKDDKNFAAIEDWMIPILTEGKKLRWSLSTMKLILLDKVESKFTISELTISDAEFIYENSDYKDVISIEYIMDRIENGINSCIRYENTPVAWAITQDDGAIGFLHVLPQHRRKGYAKSIIIDLSKKVQKENKIPFVHIEESNENSMMLALDLGFEKYKRVSWFEIE